MEKFLFRKVELWFVLILVIAGVLGLLVFGAVLRNQLLDNDRFGRLGKIALAIAELPSTVEHILGADQGMKALGTARFGDRAGWTVTDNAKAPPGYLLLSRFDGDLGKHVVEMVDLDSHTTQHSWALDADTLFANLNFDERHSSPVTITTARFRAIHPLLTTDGGLIVKNHDSPLIRVDHCARLVWDNDDFTFHHSTNRDADGKIWIPSYAEPSPVQAVKENYQDHALVRIDDDGRVEEVISVTEALMRSGKAARLFGNIPYDKDKLHLNDIQPVLEDGPFWRKGDLFLSLRNLSAIALYRPTTGEIAWYKEGPWSQQHDVDILDNHRIGVFDNAVYDHGDGRRVQTHSDVVIYDFATDEASRPFAAVFADLGMRTETEGLFDMLPGGRVIVEEENSGRILVLEADGTLIFDFVNRAADGKVYRLGWSRYVVEEYGNEVLSNIRSNPCP